MKDSLCLHSMLGSIDRSLSILKSSSLISSRSASDSKPFPWNIFSNTFYTNVKLRASFIISNLDLGYIYCLIYVPSPSMIFYFFTFIFSNIHFRSFSRICFFNSFITALYSLSSFLVSIWPFIQSWFWISEIDGHFWGLTCNIQITRLLNSSDNSDSLIIFFFFGYSKCLSRMFWVVIQNLSCIFSFEISL